MLSRKQALTRVLSYYDRGLLGAMRNGNFVYGATRNGVAVTCPVGALFSPLQLAEFKVKRYTDSNTNQRRRLNSTKVDGLVNVYGLEFVENTTGLKLQELQKLQSLHDESYEHEEIAEAKTGTKLRNYLVRELNKLA